MAGCALLRCGVLGASTCARPRSTEPATTLLLRKRCRWLRSGLGTRKESVNACAPTLSFMAPEAGFEPATSKLTASCSTAELLRNANYSAILPVKCELVNYRPAFSAASIRRCSSRRFKVSRLSYCFLPRPTAMRSFMNRPPVSISSGTIVLPCCFASMSA